MQAPPIAGAPAKLSPKKPDEDWWRGQDSNLRSQGYEPREDVHLLHRTLVPPAGGRRHLFCRFVRVVLARHFYGERLTLAFGGRLRQGASQGGEADIPALLVHPFNRC